MPILWSFARFSSPIYKDVSPNGLAAFVRQTLNTFPLGLTFHRHANRMVLSLFIQSSCFAFQTNKGNTNAKTEAITQKFPTAVKS